MCEPIKKEVNWVIKDDLINIVKNSILNDDKEISGKIMFIDTECKKDVCNKTSTDFNITNGQKSSVMTPNGIINFHTHPGVAYKNQNAVYGWPSGEDMAQTIYFAKQGNLIHIVFSLEGAYVINVKHIIPNRFVDMMEKILKETHVFRSKDQQTQLKNFKNFTKYTGIVFNQKTTVNMWLKLINSLTVKNICLIYNSLYNKNVIVIEDNNKIFDVKLNKMNSPFSFKGFYINEACHRKSYYGRRS
jgi:hypothetical protein